MSDFPDDMAAEDGIPEQTFENETEEEVRLIETSAPPPNESEPEPEKTEMTNNGKVKPETVEIQNKTAVLPYVTSQSPRTKHFQFKNTNDKDNLTKVFTNNGLTVEYNTVRDKPYITLNKGGETVGKIQFLYYNENTPQDKYIKLHLFDFTDPSLYSTVKSKLVDFFENFKPAAKEQGGARRKSSKKHRHIPRRTHKKRRNVHRKKTLRRK